MTTISSKPIVGTAPAPVSTLERAKRVAGLQAAPRLSRDELIRDVKLGVVTSVPMEAIFESQKYRRGEIKANQYVANVVSNSIGFGAWTIGGALAAAALAPVGLPVFVVGVAGFAAGMIANDLFDRTFGTAIKKVLGDAIPEQAVKPLANVFTRFVANPLNDYLWKPVSGFVMQHKVLSGIALAGLALRFPFAAKAVGKEVAMMAAGTGVAMGVQLKVVDRFLPPAAEH